MLLLVPVGQVALEDAECFDRAIGGAESNVAMGLARLGVPSGWVSRVGDDGLGRYLVRAVAAGGVDVRHVEFDPARPTGVYFKDFTRTGTRVRYYRRGSAAAAMSWAWFDRSWLDGVEILHLTGITPALSASCRELITRLLESEPRTLRISIDVNWRPDLWTDADPTLLTRLARRADIVLIGDDEAAALWGTGEPGEVRERFPEPAEVVVKHGARGATLLEAGADPCFVPALSLDGRLVDAVGAGDAFAAGFLAGRLDRRGPADCLRMGHIMGAAALTTSGDVPAAVPDEEIAELLSLTDAEWKELRWRPGQPTGIAPRR
jgi:2-dehydro-3-deoxygluconokinase